MWFLTRAVYRAISMPLQAQNRSTISLPSLRQDRYKNPDIFKHAQTVVRSSKFQLNICRDEKKQSFAWFRLKSTLVLTLFCSRMASVSIGFVWSDASYRLLLRPRVRERVIHLCCQQSCMFDIAARVPTAFTRSYYLKTALNKHIVATYVTALLKFFAFSPLPVKMQRIQQGEIQTV